MEIKNKIKQKRKLLLVNFVLFITLTSFITILTPVKGSYETYIRQDELKTAVVRDLKKDTTYVFDASFNTGYYDFDLALFIYDKNDFTNRSLLASQDNPGIGFESIVYTTARSGDHYIGVCLNNDDNGIAIISVFEQGTSVEEDVEYQSIGILYSLVWLWIMLGAFGIVLIVLIVGGVLIFTLIVKKQRDIVAKARETGEALPRAGVRKNKCPFCNVKLPPDNLVQCPYCGAPITE